MPGQVCAGSCYNSAMHALKLIDTHTHLHLAQFDDDRAAVLARATAAGVARSIEDWL